MHSRPMVVAAIATASLAASAYAQALSGPALVKALDIMLVLQADHEQNCSTNAVRAVGSIT